MPEHTHETATKPHISQIHELYLSLPRKKTKTMNKKVIYLLSLISLLCFSYGCDDQKADWYGKNSYRVPNEVGDALRNRYPDAQYIEWELEDGYYVASFRSDGFEVEAWYDTSATWRMSSTEIVYKLLSEGIQSTIGEKGYYASNVEDIHKIERPYFCVHYYMELSQTEMICIESGQLLAHSNDLPDSRPIEIPENIMQELGIAYTDMRVIEAEQISENVWKISYYDTNGTQTITNKLTAEGEILKDLPIANIK